MYNRCTHKYNAVVAQLVRASACHAEGRGFKSHSPRIKHFYFDKSKYVAQEKILERGFSFV